MELESHKFAAPGPTPPNPNTDLDPEIEQKMLADFDLLWQQIGNQESESHDAEEIEAMRTQMLEREYQFVKKVIATTIELANQHQGTITLLFDVDETIAKNILFADPPKTIVRPAFAATINSLAKLLPKRIEVGLLTSRGQSHLDKEKVAPTYLADIDKYVNPDFLISSRDGTIVSNSDEIRSLEYGNTDDQKRLPLVVSIIKPKIIQAIMKDGEFTEEWRWFDNKLAVLAILAQENLDRAFVFVDDMAFADSILDTGNRVRGVRVYEDAGFFLP